MSAPNLNMMRAVEPRDTPSARSDEQPRSSDDTSAAGERPQDGPAQSKRRRASDASQYDLMALAWIEEKLEVARRENDGLKARNRSLARDLAAASQRGTEAHHLAYHDGLTGLPNRLMLMQRLQNGIAEAAQRQRQLALLFIDLDHFKRVNDHLGHAVGDKALTIVASRLLGAIRASDIACRYGGDEFVVLLSDIADATVVSAIVDKVRARIEGSYGIDGIEVHIQASIGFALYPLHGDQCSALLSHADASMYQCKATRSSRGDAQAMAAPDLRRMSHGDGAGDAQQAATRSFAPAAQTRGPIKA